MSERDCRMWFWHLVYCDNRTTTEAIRSGSIWCELFWLLFCRPRVSESRICLQELPHFSADKFSATEVLLCLEAGYEVSILDFVFQRGSRMVLVGSYLNLGTKYAVRV